MARIASGFEKLLGRRLVRAMKPMSAAVVLLAALLVGGCGQSNEGAPEEAGASDSKARSASGLDQIPDAGPCESIVAGGGRLEVIIEPGCTGCTVTDAEKAVDNDLSTAATVTFGTSVARAAGVRLRAIAPPGTVFPAGIGAFALVQEPQGAMVRFCTKVNTLRDGGVQESGGFCGAGGARIFPATPFGVRSTLPYDAVEFYASLSEVAADQIYLVHEICNDLE